MTLKDLARHAVIAGTTGGGKTMLLIKILQQAIGQGIGLDSALALLSPSRPEFDAIMAKVGPELKRLRVDVFDDFQKLAATKNARQQEGWVESSIGLLRDLLRPMLRQTFGQMAPSA